MNLSSHAKVRSAGNAQSMVAFRHGDAAAVAACSIPEAKLVPPHPSITGTPGIQAFWHGEMHHRTTERALETLDIMARADLVVEVGTYRVTRQSAGGETVTDTGTYTVVWMKEGAQWKMPIDMWTTSPQPQTAAEAGCVPAAALWTTGAPARACVRSGAPARSYFQGSHDACPSPCHGRLTASRWRQDKRGETGMMSRRHPGIALSMSPRLIRPSVRECSCLVAVIVGIPWTSTARGRTGR